MTVAAAMTDIATEAGTVQVAGSPVGVPEGKDKWLFRLPQSNTVMGYAVVESMKKQGIKTIGFLGYTDAYGEQWLKEITPQLDKAGIKIVATERFARTDASVGAQALKLVQANPDAILVVASGGGAAQPHRTLIERGYKGRIYQTHAAAGRDFLRLGGKDVEGAYVIAAPSLVPDQLPANHPSKPYAAEFVQSYEGAYGAGTRAIFSASVYDLVLLLQNAVPKALKAAKPGTQAFRTALRDAVEQSGTLPVANGTFAFSKDNHWGYGPTSPVMLKVANGDWKVD